MLDEERRQVQEQICWIIENDCHRDFEPVFERAYQLLGVSPAGAESELRNANNHKALALQSDVFADAELNLARARRHYHYGKYLCLVQIVSHQLSYCNDYLTTVENDFGQVFPDLQRRYADVVRAKDDIDLLDVPRRSKSALEVGQDSERINQACAGLEILAVRANELAEAAYRRFPIDNFTLAYFARKLRGFRFQFAGEAGRAILFATLSGFLGALFYHLASKL